MKPFKTFKRFLDRRIAGNNSLPEEQILATFKSLLETGTKEALLAHVEKYPICQKHINNMPDFLSKALMHMDYNDSDFISKCVAITPDINHRSEGQHPPLYTALLRNNLDIIQCFLDNGADVNVTSKTGTPILNCAARLKVRFDIFKKLVDAGADINAVDANGISVVRHTLQKKSKLHTILLLEKGAQMDFSTLEPNELLSLANFTQNPNIKDSKGEHVLKYAVASNSQQHINATHMLLGAGADIFAEDAQGNAVIADAHPEISSMIEKHYLKNFNHYAHHFKTVLSQAFQVYTALPDEIIEEINSYTFDGKFTTQEKRDLADHIVPFLFNLAHTSFEECFWSSLCEVLQIQMRKHGRQLIILSRFL